MLKYLHLLLLFVALAPVAMAQPSEEQQVTDAVTMLTKAMVDADKTELENLVSDQLSYGHSSGRVEDKQAFVENIINGKSDFVNIDLAEQTISISSNVAVVRHTFSATTNDSGNPGTVKLHVLLVWQLEGDSWKLLTRQAVKVP